MNTSLEKQACLSNEGCDSRIFEVETVLRLALHKTPR
jgi:hypothetical protein